MEKKKLKNPRSGNIKGTSGDSSSIINDNAIPTKRKYWKLRNKYALLLEDKLLLKEKRIKQEETILEIRKQRFELEENHNIQSFNRENEEKSIQDINQVSKVLSNAIKRFTESQAAFKEIFDNIQKCKDNVDSTLLEEYKKYVNEQKQIFFDAWNEMRNKYGNNEYNNKKAKKDRQQILWLQGKVREWSSYKNMSDDSTGEKEKEKEMIEKRIKEWEDESKETNRINKSIQEKIARWDEDLEKNKNKFVCWETKLGETVNFVYQNCDPNMWEEFANQVKALIK